MLTWHCSAQAWCWLGTGRRGSALDRHDAWAAGLDGDILRVGVHFLPAGDKLRVGDRNPVSDGVECPRPHGNVPGRTEMSPAAWNVSDGVDVQARRCVYPAGTDGVSRHYYSPGRARSAAGTGDEEES